MVATPKQEIALKEFVEQLPDILAENEKIIKDFETNYVRAAGDGEDNASKSIKALKNHNDMIRRFLDRMAPDQFPNQVR